VSCHRLYAIQDDSSSLYERSHYLFQTAVPSLPCGPPNRAAYPDGYVVYSACHRHHCGCFSPRPIWNANPGHPHRSAGAIRREGHGTGITDGPKKSALEHIDKPDSVPTRLARESGMIISLELELPRTSCSLPEDHGRDDRRVTAPVPAPPVLLFGLAPGDAYRAGHVTTTAVGFYSTISPLPDPHRRIASSRPSAVSFLWRWCRIAPPGRYPAPFPWSPDFPPEHVLGRSSDLLQRAQLL